MKISDLKNMPEFYDRYINLAPENLSVIDGLIQTSIVLEEIRNELIQHQDYQYEPNKWTPKEMVQHIIDNERIMSYRALALARGEQKNLPGYEHNEYVVNSFANRRSMNSLLEEFAVVRKSTVLLFHSLEKETLLNSGLCSEIAMTPLALGLVCIGHVEHHINILKERYFTK
ncbi:DinB family protein [Wenyingzhuangia sp. 1_MG-2023]|nr:DinB family protein [Wenyingzhuangia sp. 1_MG-2023]